jgi:hypothetical protein
MFIKSGEAKFSIDKNPREHDETESPWYDTKEGIAKSLETLSAFQYMLMERCSAGYDRDERMNEFYVLGRFWLDTCGNCGKIEGYIPKEQFPDIPDVLTRDEFFAYLKERVEGDGPMISSSMQSGLPAPNITCPVCGKGWDMTNCHDTVVRHKTEAFPLAEFVGQTLLDVKTHFNQRTDAVYGMQSDILIRNKHFIDLSPKYPDAEPGSWKEGIKVNDNGWVSERDGIDDNYVIQEGDEGFFNIWTYLHKPCNRQNLAATEESEFRKIFENAGFQTVEMEGIPNKYCPCERCAPWFNVRTEFGTIVIGWRKRVINIDWTGVKPKRGKLISLFKDEDVTKGDGGIHAWGWEKAQDYLTRIREKLAA